MATPAAGLSNSFSPTLARLLTAPERNFAMGAAQGQNASGNSNNTSFFGATQAQSSSINLTKNAALRAPQQLQTNQPEISCLPISQILAFQQQNQSNSLLHQQLQRHQRDNNKYRSKTNAFICGTVSCRKQIWLYHNRREFFHQNRLNIEHTHSPYNTCYIYIYTYSTIQYSFSHLIKNLLQKDEN